MTSSSWSVDECAAWYDAPHEWVRSNLVLSLDGAIADRSGSSRGLSTPSDKTVLRVLRAISDVVIVGGRTARQERYSATPLHPSVSRLATSLPRLAVISLSCQFQPTDDMFTTSTRPIVLTTRGGSTMAPEWLHERAQVVITDADITGTWVRDVLFDMSLTRVVVEGGPTIQRLMLADNVVDEIDVTLAPTIVGLGVPSKALGPHHIELHPLSTCTHDDSVFWRLLVSSIDS